MFGLMRKKTHRTALEAVQDQVETLTNERDQARNRHTASQEQVTNLQAQLAQATQDVNRLMAERPPAPIEYRKGNAGRVRMFVMEGEKAVLQSTASYSSREAAKNHAGRYVLASDETYIDTPRARRKGKGRKATA